MAATKVIVPCPSVLAGLTPIRSLQSVWPNDIELIDMRVLGQQLERLGFTAVSTTPLAEPSKARLTRLGAGAVLLQDALAICNMEYEVFYQTHAGATHSVDWDLSVKDYPALPWRFVSMNGAFGLLDYMSDGVLGVEKPGQFPSTALETLDREWHYQDTSDAVSLGVLYMKLASSEAVYGAHVFLDGCLIYGDGSVARYILRENAAAGSLSGQHVLSTVGLLSRDAWAGHAKGGFFISKDRQLCKIDEKGVMSILGFGHLWPDATRARLTYVAESNELFILVDEGDDEHDGFTNPVGYLYGVGLTSLSVAPASVCYDAGSISVLGTDGILYTMNMPYTAAVEDFDWTGYRPTVTEPSRDPDLVTDWADFGTAWDKNMLGVQMYMLPMWPVFVKVESIGTSALNVQTFRDPMAAFSLADKMFRISVWFPTFAEAGAFSVRECRLQIEGDDQRGIYAAAQATSGQSK